MTSTMHPLAFNRKNAPVLDITTCVPSGAMAWPLAPGTCAQTRACGDRSSVDTAQTIDAFVIE
jgi:hypothetical protein